MIKYFQYNKIPTDDECCACLSVTLLDSIFVNSNKDCYLQIFLGECKYEIKDRKIMNTINENLRLNKSDDENDEYLIRPYFKFFFNGFNNVCYF